MDFIGYYREPWRNRECSDYMYPNEDQNNETYILWNSVILLRYRIKKMLGGERGTGQQKGAPVACVVNDSNEHKTVVCHSSGINVYLRTLLC